MRDETQQDFVDELCPRLRPIISSILKSDGACQALDFFRRRPRTWLQASDLSYYIRQPLKRTQLMLELLTQAGILEQFTVLNQLVFYGLSQHSESVRALDQYWACRDDWHARLEQVEDALHLPPKLGSTLELL